MQNIFDFATKSWNLSSPVLIAETAAHRIYKVIDRGRPAILKLPQLANSIEMAREAQLLQIWNGRGAARLIKFSESALLLESIDGPSLAQKLRLQKFEKFSRSGANSLRVAELANSVCELLDVIHIPVATQTHLFESNRLPSLETHFHALFVLAAIEGTDPIFQSTASVARELLAQPLDAHILHGDIHPENILISTDGVAKVIDPKGVIGERTFDVTNLFFNLERFWPWSKQGPSVQSEIIMELAEKLAERLEVSTLRVLQFAYAHGGLSVAWMLEDDQDPSVRLEITRQIGSLFR